MVAKSVEQAAVHPVGKDLDIPLHLPLSVQRKDLADRETDTRVMTHDHPAHRKVYAVRNRPHDIFAVRRHRDPAGIDIRILYVPQRRIQITVQTKRHVESRKRAPLVTRKDQPALGLSRPVSARRHDKDTGIRIRKIRVDACDVPVPVVVRKRIRTGAVQIRKRKSAEIAHDIDNLHVTLWHGVHIQMDSLLDPVTPVRETALPVSQVSRPKNARPCIEPRLAVVMRIDLEVAEPVDRRVSPVARRLHVGRAERDLTLIQIVQDLLPAFAVIEGAEHTVPIILDDRGTHDHPGRLHGHIDTGKTKVQRSV